ncbi:uncharacterized protein MAL13P1.304-like [Musca vetustissima]|uniref:uncharacterized protein MAL13P1.304-like n=1 Tax=Musca vetustissima TaxID=27455 RepID=UPI002AB6AD24|nr:uncharacterized protein MAL13P1.304-like [Musca vetustissima]
MAKGFPKLERYIHDQEPGIFDMVLKWFSTFLNFQDFINPHEKKLLQQYERVAIIVITYIIEYLQHTTDDVSEYHYKLLKMLDKLLHKLPPNILERCNKYESGTIAYLWQPNAYGIDYKTHELILKIFSILMKYINRDKWNLEFEEIKYLNLNINEIELEYVIMQTEHSSLSLKNSEKFWLELDKQTLSFEGRIKPGPNRPYENIEGNVNVIKMEINDAILAVYFNESHFDCPHIIPNEQIIQIFMTTQELDRLCSHEIIQYFLNIVLTKETPLLDDNSNALNSMQDNSNNLSINNSISKQPITWDESDFQSDDEILISPGVIENIIHRLSEDIMNDEANQQELHHTNISPIMTSPVIASSVIDISESLTQGHTCHIQASDSLNTNRSKELHGNSNDIFDESLNCSETINDAANQRKINNYNISSIMTTPVTTKKRKSFVKYTHPLRKISTKRNRTNESDEEYRPYKKPKKRSNNNKNRKSENTVKEKYNKNIQINKVQCNEKLCEKLNEVDISESLIQRSTPNFQDTDDGHKQSTSINGRKEIQGNYKNVIDDPLECPDFQKFREGIEGRTLLQSSHNNPNKSTHLLDAGESVIFDLLRSCENTLNELPELALGNTPSTNVTINETDVSSNVDDISKQFNNNLRSLTSIGNINLDNGRLSKTKATQKESQGVSHNSNLGNIEINLNKENKNHKRNVRREENNKSKIKQNPKEPMEDAKYLNTRKGLRPTKPIKYDDFDSSSTLSDGSENSPKGNKTKRNLKRKNITKIELCETNKKKRPGIKGNTKAPTSSNDLNTRNPLHPDILSNNEDSDCIIILSNDSMISPDVNEKTRKDSKKLKRNSIELYEISE